MLEKELLCLSLVVTKYYVRSAREGVALSPLLTSECLVSLSPVELLSCILVSTRKRACGSFLSLAAMFPQPPICEGIAPRGLETMRGMDVVLAPRDRLPPRCVRNILNGMKETTISHVMHDFESDACK